MNFKLHTNSEGKVKYIAKDIGKQKDGSTGSNTPLSSAEWMLKQGKPFKSDEFEGFPVAVKLKNMEYHFDGEWEAEPSIFTEDAPEAQKGPCGPDYCDIEPGPTYSRKGAGEASKPRKRRVKDVVCE